MSLLFFISVFLGGIIWKKTILNEYITNQYPIEKYKKLITLSLDIVENFLLKLESGFDYNSIPVSFL